MNKQAVTRTISNVLAIVGGSYLILCGIFWLLYLSPSIIEIFKYPISINSYHNILPYTNILVGIKALIFIALGIFLIIKKRGIIVSVLWGAFLGIAFLHFVMALIPVIIPSYGNYSINFTFIPYMLTFMLITLLSFCDSIKIFAIPKKIIKWICLAILTIYSILNFIEITYNFVKYDFTIDIYYIYYILFALTEVISLFLIVGSMIIYNKNENNLLN